MASELKACPLCHDEIRWHRSEVLGEGGNIYHVRNLSCHVEFASLSAEDDERVIREWNTRVPSPAEQMLVEALQAEIDRCRCGGTGLYSYSDEQPKIDCGECADMRAALRAAEGRAG